MPAATGMNADLGNGALDCSYNVYGWAYTRLPIAPAGGMGVNAYFAYIICCGSFDYYHRYVYDVKMDFIGNKADTSAGSLAVNVVPFTYSTANGIVLIGCFARSRISMGLCGIFMRCLISLIT